MANDDLLPNSEEDMKTNKMPAQIVLTTPVQTINAPDELLWRHIRTLTEGQRIDVDKWLITLNKFYDEENYSSLQRIACTIKFLNEEQTKWYEQNKDEINENWSLFCERLKQNLSNRKPTRPIVSSSSNSSLNNNHTTLLEDLIDTKFDKYSGVGDGKCWLLQTMNQFKACGLRRDDQFAAIPLLLEGDAFLWYADHSDTIFNFETFSKLFLQQFKSIALSPTSPVGGTRPLVPTVPDRPSVSHLQRTVADEIIKRPTYFHGSQDDVHDWIEKLEQRFAMAQWNDENKLHYISIHLQDDAYRWWMQTSSTIKTWSSFKDSVTRAFGSTRMQEVAFEQLKWYKQTINQSITQYYDQVIELCKKVDPAMPDSLKLKYLMAGIKESLKTHVALQDPKTPEAFLSSARKIEDIFALTNADSGSFPNEITLNANSYQSQPIQTNCPPTSNNNINQNQPQYTDGRI